MPKYANVVGRNALQTTYKNSEKSIDHGYIFVSFGDASTYRTHNSINQYIHFRSFITNYHFSTRTIVFEPRLYFLLVKLYSKLPSSNVTQLKPQRRTFHAICRFDSLRWIRVPRSISESQNVLLFEGPDENFLTVHITV